MEMNNGQIISENSGIELVNNSRKTTREYTISEKYALLLFTKKKKNLTLQFSCAAGGVYFIHKTRRRSVVRFCIDQRTYKIIFYDLCRIQPSSKSSAQHNFYGSIENIDVLIQDEWRVVPTKGGPTIERKVSYIFLV